MRLILIIFFGLAFSSYCQPTVQKANEFVLDTVWLEFNKMEIIGHKGSSNSSTIYISVHEDEKTGIEALRVFSQRHEINYFFLKHNGERRIGCWNKSDTSSVDPNRIYSEKGVKATLEDGGKYTIKLSHGADNLADGVLKSIDTALWIIAVHNNTPDNYSILSYLPKGSEYDNMKKVFVNYNSDPDDFVYTTDQGLYEFLRNNHISVILQDNDQFIDDGSLSVYCGQHNRAYANIETEHGHILEQIDLLEMLTEYIQQLDVDPIHNMNH